jgi:hypothetical protein
MATELKFDATAKERFLQELGTHGIKKKACKAVGITYMTLRRHMEKDPKFTERVQVALEEAGDEYEAEAHRRAVEGVKQQMFNKHGEPTGTVTKYSDRLLERMLIAAKPHKYGDRKTVEVTGSITHDHMIKAKDSIMKKLEKAVGKIEVEDAIIIQPEGLEAPVEVLPAQDPHQE